MERKLLLKISFIMFLLSLFFLIIFSNTLEPRITKIAQINKTNLDEWIKIRGEIINMKALKSEKGEITIFEVSDGTGRVRVVLYQSVNLENKFSNSKIEVIGKIINSEKELQIQAKKITFL